MPTLVTLIVLNYNGKKFLETLLPSIRKQTFRDFDILLVENGSTDDSAEYVRQNYPEVVILTIEKNIGFSRAVNFGFKHAKGTLAVLVCNDNRMDEHWLEELVTAAQRDERGIFSTRNMDFSHPEVIDDVGGTNNILGYPIAIGHHERMGPAYEGVREVFAPCGNCFIISRQLFLDLGGFDEHYFGYLEDSDLGWRARLFGYRSYCVSSAVAYHMLSATWGRESSTKRYLIERNRLYMMAKNFSMTTLIKLFPLLLVFEMVKFAFFLLTGNFSECKVLLRAYWWNLSHPLALRQQRKAVQSKRVRTDREILPFLQTRFAGGSFFGMRYQPALKLLSWFLRGYCRVAFGPNALALETAGPTR